MVLCLLTSNLFAQISVSLTGNVKLFGQSNHSGISVTVKSYLVDGNDLFGINETATTDAAGNYSLQFDIPEMCGIPVIGCLSVAAIPLYIRFEKNTLIDTINENVPLTLPTSNVTYTITKSPVLGAYVPQICIVTVDTAKNQIFLGWERKNDPTIVRYNVLRSLKYDGQYDSISYIKQSYENAAFRDSSINPNTQKAFYKIVAVYNNGDKSPSSYPKTSLSLRVEPDDQGITNLTLINPEDIPMFDHGLYDTISVLRSSDKKNFEVFKSYSLNSAGDLVSILQGLQDEMTAPGNKYYYLAKGDLIKECTPSLLKSDSGPFSQSLSNLAESELTQSFIVSDALPLQVSPNPTKAAVRVTVPEKGMLFIVDAKGSVIFKNEVSKGIFSYTIPKAGIYSIVLKASRKYSSKIVVD